MHSEIQKSNQKTSTPTVDRRRIDKEITLVVEELKSYNSEARLINYLEVHSARYKVDIENVCGLISPGSSILDFGAHPYATVEVLSRLGYKVTGADIDPATCDYIDKLSFPVIKCAANTASIPLDDDAFDAIIFTEVFEHLYLNPIVTVREIKRVLKPSGILYLTTPNGLGLRKMMKVMRKGRFQQVFIEWSRLEATGIAGHVTEYSPGEIQDFLMRSGFASVKTKTQNVYRKSNSVEHYFWKFATSAFPNARETIISVARK